MTTMMNENDSMGRKFENGIWKGPTTIPPDNYFKYGKILLESMRMNSTLIGQIDAITGQQRTFGDMADRSIRCALWLKSQGIKSSDIIAISTENHLDSVIPIVSSLLIGSIFNPWWDYLDEEELIHYFISLTQTKVVFASEANAKLIKKVSDKMQAELRIIVFGKIDGLESFDEILATQDPQGVLHFKCTEIKNPDHPAMILYTSGTTDNPKGVVIAYRTLGNGRPFMPKEVIKKSSGINFSTLSWISGIINSLTAIEFGSKLIIFYGITNSESFQLINKYKVEWITMGAGIASKMSKDSALGQYEYSSVKHICFGGACIKTSVVEFLNKTFPNAQIAQCYGTTEMGGTATRTDSGQSPDSCGKVSKNMDIKIIDENEKIITEPNVEGELCVKSSTLMLGYYKNPEATSAAIDTNGWFHTGDLGYYNEYGEFFITDRIRELIKCGLYHIPPAPIEEMIQRNHPGVYEVAVVKKPHSTDVEHPIAFVVKMPGVEVTKQEIIDIVDQNMSDRFKLRGGVELLDDLPRTPSGKVAKKILRDIASQIASKQSI